MFKIPESTSRVAGPGCDFGSQVWALTGPRSGTHHGMYICPHFQIWSCLTCLSIPSTRLFVLRITQKVPNTSDGKLVHLGTLVPMWKHLCPMDTLLVCAQIRLCCSIMVLIGTRYDSNTRNKVNKTNQIHFVFVFSLAVSKKKLRGYFCNFGVICIVIFVLQQKS